MFGALDNEIIGSHTRNEWLQKVTDQGHACFWCGSPICDPDVARDSGVAVKAKNKAVPDHLCPRSRGGVDFIWNIVAACEVCNNIRNNRMPGDFLRDRIAFAKPVDDGKKIYTTIPLIKERDEAGDPYEGQLGGEIRVTSHLELCDFAAQMVSNLAAKMPTIERSDEWYRQRRKVLANQVIASIPRLLEAAGQMQLPLQMASSVKKEAESEAAALVTTKGLHVADQPRRA